MNRNSHHRAGGQPTSQVCQCHFTRMHCVRVGCFVKTPENVTAVFIWGSGAHRSELDRKVCEANGARSAHVGLL